MNKWKPPCDWANLAYDCFVEILKKVHCRCGLRSLALKTNQWRSIIRIYVTTHFSCCLSMMMFGDKFGRILWTNKWMICEQLWEQNQHNTLSSIKMSFGIICYIRLAWKSMVKVGCFKIFMRNNKSNTKWIFLSFSLNMTRSPKIIFFFLTWGLHLTYILHSPYH